MLVFTPAVCRGSLVCSRLTGLWGSSYTEAWEKKGQAEPAITIADPENEEEAELLAAIKRAKRVPKIFYATRTHSQIAQVCMNTSAQCTAYGYKVWTSREWSAGHQRAQAHPLQTQNGHSGGCSKQSMIAVSTEKNTVLYRWHHAGSQRTLLCQQASCF